MSIRHVAIVLGSIALLLIGGGYVLNRAIARLLSCPVYDQGQILSLGDQKIFMFHRMCGALGKNAQTHILLKRAGYLADVEDVGNIAIVDGIYDFRESGVGLDPGSLSIRAVGQTIEITIFESERFSLKVKEAANRVGRYSININGKPAKASSY